MHRSSFRSGLFLGAAIVCATASPAMANTDSEDGATPQRDYLPAEIVVTGERAGYDTADGSTATKTPTPLIDVPQSATFITEDQLEDQSIRQLGEALRFPKAVARNLGVEVARKLQAQPDLSPRLRQSLSGVASAEDQAEILRRFVESPAPDIAREKPEARQKSVKYEFHVGATKITARKGECRILSETDFSSVDRRRLQRAIEAFEAVLREG